jgi:hypothetical protein
VQLLHQTLTKDNNDLCTGCFPHFFIPPKSPALNQTRHPPPRPAPVDRQN